VSALRPVRLDRLLGWAVPPALALAVTAYSLHRTGVDARDVVVFGAYAGLGLVLPGFVIWRLLVSNRTWSVVADVACGTSLAYAVELAVYLLCTHLGHPGIAFLWPVVPLALSALPRLRTRVWRGTDTKTPMWWSWLFSGLAVYSVSDFSRTYWDVYPLSGNGARFPYIDIPYHLSLIGALSRDVPVDVPAVDGQPLYYHWFVHAELAASRHATGIEPFVLLTRLGPLLMALVVIVGVAALTHRLAGSYVAGGTAAVLLTCAANAPLTRDFGPLFQSGHLFLSPTTVFAMAVLIAVIALSTELLMADRRPGPAVWVLAALTLAAASGAKGTLLPVLIAGYVAVVLMAFLVTRRLHVAGLGLLALSTVWFLLAQKFIYGGSSQGTNLEPFGIGDRIATNLHMVPAGTDPSFALAVTATLVYLVSRLTIWVGAAGLFTPDQWRDPRAHFLVGSSVAAVGAVAAFNNSAFNQVYFLLVAPPLIAISSGWGLSRLSERVPRPVVVRVLAMGVLGGLAIGFFTKRHFVDHADAAYSWGRLAWPVIGSLVAGLVIAVMIAVAVSRGVGRRPVIAMAFATVIVSLGLPDALATTASTLTSPHQQYRESSPQGRPSFGVGGITAARWLRDHSSPEDIVATNDHCQAKFAVVCDHRSTWIAGFSERQLLLEGWAYTSRTSIEADKQDVPVAIANYWDPRRLHDNDIAFTDPTRADIRRLHDKYGVDWMFVDRRSPADVKALKKVADLRFHVDQYVVFSIR
jgi:hypothetical protein